MSRKWIYFFGSPTTVPRFCGTTFLLALAVIQLTGCNLLTGTRATAPVVEFTSVPRAEAGNPNKVTTIEGRVRGAQPGQQIVLYAGDKTTWYVQPLADQPFTKIQSDSTWSNSTHPGAEYAALLVGPDFHPPPVTTVLPKEGVLASAVTKGTPPFWQRRWFYALCVMVGALVIFGVHRMHLHQTSVRLNLRFEERLAERGRIAQELHDTLLQGVLSATMQLHVVVDGLPEASPVRAPLNRILQMMGEVVEGGRNTIRGLRSSIEDADDLLSSLSRIPQELGKPGANFRVVVEGVPLPLRPTVRDEVYRIGREALSNALQHSGAENIDLYLQYAPDQLRILVQDDGCGIDPDVLSSGRNGHGGLSSMRERAEKIGARVRVLSRTGGGTEVELRVPSSIAWEPPGPNSAASRLRPRHREETVIPQ